MKKYLASITSPRGVCMSIAYYADTPNKNYRLYHCGVDTGERFEYYGNASRALHKYLRLWCAADIDITKVKTKYATKNEIPRRGSNA